MPAFNPNQPFDLPPLLADAVPIAQWESLTVLKACVEARAALAALDQAVQLIPNPGVLISSLVLLESQASSEIENIVTTSDELFRYAEHKAQSVDPAIKETLRYRESLFHGLDALKAQPIATRLLERLCTLTKGVDMRVRKIPGTALMSQRSGEVIYTPPQGEAHLRELLADWERFLHADKNDTRRGAGLDPLVRMAVLHYQFEAIHPFLDGNGRTGRIVNLLFLVNQGLLREPVLYLSRYILAHRTRYYELLLAVSTTGTPQAWQDWLLFMLQGVHLTARQTLSKIDAIRKLMRETQERVEQTTKLGKQTDLVQLMFRLPYCRVANVVAAGIAKRQTAAVYLQSFVACGVLQEQLSGREKLYVNRKLIELLKNQAD